MSVELAVVPAEETMPSSPSALVRLVAEPHAVVAAFQDFDRCKHELLSADDYYHVGGKDRIIKSGWRKIAAAFGISTELVRSERYDVGNDPKRPALPRIVVECVVRAIAPNGRYADGVGKFDSAERVMAHLEHDVFATAYTRACNRAISDLVGGGEVSAEECEAEAAPSTAFQYVALTGEIERLSADVSLLLQHYGATALHELTREQAQHALAVLRRRPTPGKETTA